MHMRCVSTGSSTKYCSPSARSASRKSGAVASVAQTLGELGAVALGDAGDQGLLAVEVDVECPRADAGLLADVVHGCAMEAGAREALLGGVEDVLAPGALDVGLQLRHSVDPSHRIYCGASKKTNDRFIL